MWLVPSREGTRVAVMAAKPQGTKAERPPLTRERVARAALGLIDRDGLEALTMRGLGRQLGVEAMSLYVYVSKKDDILDDVLDLLFRELDLPEDEGHNWEDTARALFSRLRRHLLAHPNTISLFATRVAHSAEALAPIEMSLRTLRKAGFDPWGAIDGHRILMSFTLGYAIFEVSARTSPTSHPEDWGIATYALRELPAEKLPHLSELASIALAGHANEQFDLCLTCILAGLTDRLNGRIPVPPPPRAQILARR